jgi:putative ABC transport system ATP-binding protein
VENPETHSQRGPMIRLKTVSVTFTSSPTHQKKALKNLSLTIGEGDYITVIGSNGAGKSTLLNVIAGEVIPQNGTIWIDQENVTQLPSYHRSRNVARVFQDPLSGTCADLTIAENLALAWGRGRRRSLRYALTASIRDLFYSKLKHLQLGLENRLDTPIGMLSGGQRQSISLLMATLSPLKVLLLDEHTSALDPKIASFMMELTQRIIKEQNLTTLQVTHSLNQALHYGNRTIMLHEGRIIFDISRPERDQLTVQDLLEKFGSVMDDDRLLF